MTEPIGNDIVISSEKPPPPLPVAMDAYVDLLAEERECANMIKWWKERREVVHRHIKKFLGESTRGTVGGVKAVSYEYIERFNSTEFKKQYPDMYRLYVHPITEEAFDAAMLRRMRPDLFKEFQVRSLIVDYDAPGSKDRHGKQAESQGNQD